MASLNRVILVGNLTRDPEVRNTPDGTPVANLSIAVNRPWTSKQGERTADFFRIVAWRRLAELCGQYLTKGSPIAIDGRLQSRNWETADGQKRSTVEILADNIQFLSRSAPVTESSKEEAPAEVAEPPAEAAEDEIPLEEDLQGEDVPF